MKGLAWEGGAWVGKVGFPRAPGEKKKKGTRGKERGATPWEVKWGGGMVKVVRE